MKKLITLTIALFLLAAGNAFGQSETANAGVTASATVDGSLESEVLENLAFGTVQTGATPSIGADSNDAGKVRIFGPVDYQVDLVLPATVDLQGGGDAMTVNLSYLGNTTDNNESGTESLSGSTNVTTSSAAEYFIFIGGIFAEAIPGTQEGGVYENDFTIEISID